jgi:hypothetical protein
VHLRVTGVVVEDDRILLLNQDTELALAGFPGAGS